MSLIDPAKYKVFLKQYIKDLYDIDAPMIAGAVERCLQRLEDQPPVDATEVIHGWWIQDGELDEDGNGQYHCSVCSAGEKHNPIVDVPYCWKCGAKMDGERRST